MRFGRRVFSVLLGVLVAAGLIGTTVFGLFHPSGQSDVRQNHIGREEVRLETPETLFSEELLLQEDFADVEVEYKYGPWGPYKKREETVDVLFVQRVAIDNIDVSSDANNINFVQVIIPEGRKLTIEKGATINVSGELVIEGKLVNKGTIIVDRTVCTSGNKDLGTESCGILNEGTLTNSGAILVRKGMMQNGVDGTVTNNGTINIETKDEKYPGLTISIRSTEASKKSGSFVNNGTINVKNEGGSGLSIAKGAVFENKGTVNKGKTATIEGEMTGAKPVALAE